MRALAPREGHVVSIPMRPPTDLDWAAMTIKMEAEGEPYEGKLGVAFVIANRMRATGRSAADVVLRPFQFSCWNTTEPTRRRLDDVDTNRAVWAESYKAAAAALFGLVTDPTRGATSYLNPAVTTAEQERRAGYVRANVRAEIGAHHFFIAV